MDICPSLGSKLTVGLLQEDVQLGGPSLPGGCAAASLLVRGRWAGVSGQAGGVLCLFPHHSASAQSGRFLKLTELLTVQTQMLGLQRTHLSMLWEQNQRVGFCRCTATPSPPASEKGCPSPPLLGASQGRTEMTPPSQSSKPAKRAGDYVLWGGRGENPNPPSFPRREPKLWNFNKRILWRGCLVFVLGGRGAPLLVPPLLELRASPTPRVPTFEAFHMNSWAPSSSSTASGPNGQRRAFVTFPPIPQ